MRDRISDRRPGDVGHGGEPGERVVVQSGSDETMLCTFGNGAEWLQSSIAVNPEDYR